MLIPRKMQEVVLVGLVCAIPLTSTRGEPASFRPHTVQRMIGMKVEDRDGQDTGRLWDLALDPRTGQLKYAVIASGGILGVRPRLRPVPAEVVSAATTKRNTLSLDIIKAHLDSAPTLRPSEIAALSRPERAAQINRFYENPEMRTGNRPEPGGTPLPATGNTTGGRSPAGSLKFAGRIIGNRVVNRQNEKIGEVLDLLVDFGGDKPVFAIVSAGKLFKDREHQYVVPLRALQPTDETDQWRLDASRASLEQTRPFDWRSAPSRP